MARKMKDSGIEWIGEIPEGWEIAKAKYFIDISHGSDPKTQGFIPVYGSGSESFKTCGEYKEGPAVLIGRKGATLHIPHYIEGKYWNVDTAFDVKSKSHCILKFYYYLAACFDYKYYISQTTLPGMTQSNYYNMFLPVPSLSKQFQIATYLDAHGAAFDFLISKVRSSIEEYKKLKQAVITQAVTKGVRGEREMKDSGVEWAGLVPHHWGVSKIGSIGQTSSGATPLRSKEASFFDDATIRWVRTLDLNDGLVYDSSEKITKLALASSACSIMPKGTVCVAMYGGAGTIGKCGLLMSDCATNQAVCSIVCNREIVSPIFLLMQLLALKSYWMKYAVGTRKDPNISQDVVARMKILIPPLDEQKEITDYLDAKCAEIDELIAKKEQLVKELESYKKSLIYEVVTGKREV